MEQNDLKLILHKCFIILIIFLHQFIYIWRIHAIEESLAKFILSAKKLINHLMRMNIRSPSPSLSSSLYEKFPQIIKKTLL